MRGIIEWKRVIQKSDWLLEMVDSNGYSRMSAARGGNNLYLFHLSSNEPSLQPLEHCESYYTVVYIFAGSTGTITWSGAERAQKACKRSARLETIARLAR
jgi:hypothetical protein